MNSFTFYKNYYELIRCLKPSDRLKLYDSIIEYMFEDKEPEFKDLLNGIWINIKMPLDTSKKKSLNGQKGGAPVGNQNATKTSKKQPTNNQQTTNKQAKNKQQTSKKQTNNISYFLFLISNNNFKYIKLNNRIFNKLKEWLNYKEERKENYKETGLKSLLSRIEKNIELYGEEKIIDLIDECMASNWKGIIFDKLKDQEKKKIITSSCLSKKPKEEKIDDDELRKLQEEWKELSK